LVLIVNGLYPRIKPSCKTNKLIGSLFCQFLKFVKKIGDGDIVIRENEVIEKTPEDKAEAWAQEFSSTPQVPVLPVVR
jgi:hypothetical protein